MFRSSRFAFLKTDPRGSGRTNSGCFSVADIGVTADDLSPRCVVRAYEHAGASGSGVARSSVTQQASASIESRAMTV